MTAGRLAAIVLAGGRSRRLGVDKLGVEVHGRRLVRHGVDAALGAGARVVLVGPAPDGLPDSVRVVREEPAYSGPYAAVVAGLAAVDADAEVVLVLAGDLVDPAPLLPRLVSAVSSGAEAAVAVDAEGRRQPLLAAYRCALLRERTAVGDTVDRPARALLDGLEVVEVPDDGAHTRDVDTPDDLARETSSRRE